MRFFGLNSAEAPSGVMPLDDLSDSLELAELRRVLPATHEEAYRIMERYT